MKLAGRVRWGLLIAVTVIAFVLGPRLSISGDLSALFPSQGDAAALGRFQRAFGGGDVAIVLVRGDDPEDVTAAAHELEDALAAKPSVVSVLKKPPQPSLDPSLAWLYAGPTARGKLEHALSQDGMKERLAGSRELLLSPSAAQAEEILARDPLRLAQIPWEGKTELAAGLTVSSAGDFAADGGKARLVVVQPRGRAFDPVAARALVDDFDAVAAAIHAQHPKTTAELTGGHAVAVATRALLERDLVVSGVLSTVLAALVFALTFRRLRALIAVMPPLALGTAWTLGGAALLPHGLSAMSIAFAAVVVGVGVDTGVHVYAALLDGRRQGLSPVEAAAYARKKTARPTILAALAAGCTFGALALSDLRALRELGLLCGVGEVLTSLAILQVTPEIGRLLERGAPPSAPAEDAELTGWTRFVASITGSRRGALATLVVAVAVVVAVVVSGGPKSGDAIVALRPKGLAPLETQRAIFELFGGKPGQWIVLSVDRDPEAARDRSDAIAEALDGLAAEKRIDGYDALATFAPGPRLQSARMAERAKLDLPAKRAELERALTDGGWDASAFDLSAFATPTAPPPTEPSPWLRARHLAEDGGETLAVTFVRPKGDPAADRAAEAAIRAADPSAIITGYPFLESSLKATLAHDLPRIALAALVLVAIALGASLKRPRDVILATATLATAIALVCGAMRLGGIRWHAYDALVLPVLLGITMDEAMFLLYAAREGGAQGVDGAIRRALRTQGPLVVATALTTAAGFGALLACKFDGLFDVGAVGAIGSIAGLAAALFVIPAGLRLWPSRPTSS
jgi:predicted RND superfamily exporter protein